MPGGNACRGARGAWPRATGGSAIAGSAGPCPAEMRAAALAGRGPALPVGRRLRVAPAHARRKCMPLRSRGMAPRYRCVGDCGLRRAMPAGNACRGARGARPRATGSSAIAGSAGPCPAEMRAAALAGRGPALPVGRPLRVAPGHARRKCVPLRSRGVAPRYRWVGHCGSAGPCPAEMHAAALAGHGPALPVGRPLQVAPGHARRKCMPRRSRGMAPRYPQRPSSNTTSRFTDTVDSPGATGVALSIAAPAAMARIIGIGRKPPLLFSEMLTMRRTCRPSDFA